MTPHDEKRFELAKSILNGMYSGWSHDNFEGLEPNDDMRSAMALMSEAAILQADIF